MSHPSGICRQREGGEYVPKLGLSAKRSFARRVRRNCYRDTPAILDGVRGCKFDRFERSFLGLVIAFKLAIVMIDQPVRERTTS